MELPHCYDDFLVGIGFGFHHKFNDYEVVRFGPSSSHQRDLRTCPPRFSAASLGHGLPLP
ncbi:hypothetical protein Goshw_022287 [Gossypium schwendimanii]|uniref:Uncharacterized protein n=1 Tax=Gossypium schwendimanii TaxID=34291 RepID=A0A7J9MWD7_GOSSC|nr:hypothetical protein [Gossypium schwendimanii]